MKFYRDLIYRYYYANLLNSDNTAIYCNENYMFFYKNGEFHNSKNATYIDFTSKQRSFRLKNKYYGREGDFTKESWRKFVKLRAFL
jgi:hypothetical protein